MGLNRATVIIFPFVVLAIIVLCVSSSSPIKENIFTCDCNHCDDEKKKNTIDFREKEMTTTIVPDGKTSEKESNGGGNGGNGTICARDRDFEDKTFSSMCHMLCHNKCTRFHITTQKHKNITRFINGIYRTNYYKLWDGPCRTSAERKNSGEKIEKRRILLKTFI
ncbi:hypothetical protein M0804_001531 [Polistes exclamans]|nr:hypothetical protein M0804_001531 [Polistes exclamans]